TYGWEDLTQLHGYLKEAFNHLKGTIDLYTYVIDNREINMSLSKEKFITFIEMHKCSKNNPIQIINSKKGIKSLYFEMVEGLPTALELGKPDFCKEDPEKVDNYFTYQFCCKMAEFYNDEDAHQKAANEMLSKYFGQPVQPIKLLANKKTGGKLRTDSTISFSGSYVYRELNVKFNCDCRYGPYFSVSGAMLLDKAIIDPFTPLYPLAWHKDDKMKLSISKTFRALKKSLQLLDQYYAEHPLFPEMIIDDKYYKVQIEKNIVNCLWKVTLSNKQGSCEKACVKAIQKHKYLLDTHQLLAEIRYAPKILATSFIPGNWLLVYIEYLDNHLMLHVTSNLKGQSNLKEKIKKVVKYMHDSDYVHRDLCAGNFLFCHLENDEFDVKLIDFEWSGKVGFARYSHFMNHNIQWPDSAEDGKLVTKTHDLVMLNQTFCRTDLLQDQINIEI
ncbi:10200_t:CDS:2, partial [Racocetra persica]